VNFVSVKACKHYGLTVVFFSPVSRMYTELKVEIYEEIKFCAYFLRTFWWEFIITEICLQVLKI
jgi:hypothetical protein